MKLKFIAIPLIISFLVFVHVDLRAQNTFPSSGNVGIGTTSPGAKLSFPDLNGHSNADGITWYNPSPTDYGIYRTAGAWTSPDYQQLKLSFASGIILDPGATYGKSYVDIGGGGLRVSSGNVGVGTLNPVAPLHLRGSGSGSHLMIETNTGGEGDLTWYQGGSASANQRAAFQVNASSGDFEAYVYNNSQWISWLSVNRLTSNVGIGINSSDAKLHIGGKLKIEGSNEIELGAGLTKEANAGKIGYQKFSDGLDIVGAGTTGTNRKIKFWNEGGATFTGKVGIGTASPDEALTVNGKIHVTEVKVTSTVPAPDYVFEKDYNLLTLEEIKTYIDKNKHLPEVPSAKYMEANGIQLGEMNMLLLKKIEELTLHIIEQNKRIENLEQKIN